MLDRTARTRLRTLGKNNADLVARHLVMAGRLIDDEPETAYQHAQAAMRRAGRVDVVREALALTAYATGRYAEALRELRTVRRLSGIDAHRPMEADCERGLGRPERALAVVSETDPATLTEEDAAELAIVASGARADLGEHEAGLLVLESPLVDRVKQPELLRRLSLVRADRLEELGRTEEAAELREAAGPEPELDEPVLVLDLEELEVADEDAGAPTATAAETGTVETAAAQASPEDAETPREDAEGSAEQAHGEATTEEAAEAQAVPADAETAGSEGTPQRAGEDGTATAPEGVAAGDEDGDRL